MSRFSAHLVWQQIADACFGVDVEAEARAAGCVELTLLVGEWEKELAIVGGDSDPGTAKDFFAKKRDALTKHLRGLSTTERVLQLRIESVLAQIHWRGIDAFLVCQRMVRGEPLGSDDEARMRAHDVEGDGSLAQLDAFDTERLEARFDEIKNALMDIEWTLGARHKPMSPRLAAFAQKYFADEPAPQKPVRVLPS